VQSPLTAARSNLKDVVASFVRTLIFSGELRPGVHIDQDWIAEQLGISKLPVREAMLTLGYEGLVEHRPRRGAFVAQLERQDVRDHYHIYGLVSALATRRAAERLGEDDLARLEAILAAMEDDALGADERERLNFEFHRIINRAGASTRLRSSLRVLANSMPPRFYDFVPGWGEIAQEHHRGIVAAMRAGDAQAAGQIMCQHLEESGDHVVWLLEQSGFWDDVEV
jgi:DNA-binding GntR family transcriptional regulator